jgi:predicted thioredoxin/glutaredoxin
VQYFSFNLEYNYEDKINWDKIKRIIEQTLTKPLDKMTKTENFIKVEVLSSAELRDCHNHSQKRKRLVSNNF